MDDEGFAEDGADRHARIERGERILEHKLHVPPHRAQIVAAELADILTVENDLAVGRLDQAQHAASGRRLAAAGFADEAERLAAVDRERDPIDGINAADLTRQQAAVHGEIFLQAADAEQGLGHAVPPNCVSPRWQAMRWPGAISRSSGSLSVQTLMAWRQRGAKRQPTGGLIRIGTEPPIASRRTLCSLARSMRGIERISPWVEGWPGLPKRSST